MRKGSVERRLQRWGYQARRVLVLLTDQNLYPDTEVLADQAAKNGIEVIPVQFDNEFKWVPFRHENSSQNFWLKTNFREGLGAFARRTQRTKKFDPFVLDGLAEDSPWYIASYIHVSYI